MFANSYIFLLIIIFVPLFSQAQNKLPKRQEMLYAVSLETSGDWLLQKKDIKATGYSWLQGKNSFNLSTSLKVNRYFGTKGWGMYAGLALGEYKEKYYFEVDFDKISRSYYGVITIPFDDFTTKKDFKKQYAAASLGVSKHWKIGKWFINSDFGFRIHKFTKQPLSTVGWLPILDSDTNNTSFTLASWSMNFDPKFYPITIEWQDRKSTRLNSSHVD